MGDRAERGRRLLEARERRDQPVLPDLRAILDQRALKAIPDPQVRRAMLGLKVPRVIKALPDRKGRKAT